MAEVKRRDYYGVITASKEQVGNMNIRRPFPTRQFRDMSPFLLLDHMGPKDFAAGDSFEVPPHPHAGFQTVTYFLEGSGYHKDSLGHTQTIAPGDVNWMTAGKGIVHAEYSDPEFNKKGGTIQGFQIWVNIPSEYRDTAPLFGNYSADQLPLINGENSSLRVIAGAFQDQKSPVVTFSPVELYHLNGNSDEWIIDFSEQYNAGVYLAQGKATVNGKELAEGDLLVFKKSAGQIQINLENECTHLMILAGEDLGSSHISYGPFIANSAQHLQEQAKRYESGEMGRL